MSRPTPTPLPKQPGVVRGATPHAVPNRWWDMNLMRWRGGQLQPVGGNVFLPGSLQGAVAVRDVLSWNANNGQRWAVSGNDQRLWAYNLDLQSIIDITPAGVGPLGQPGAGLGYGIGRYSEGTYGTPREAVSDSDISPNLGDWWSMDLFGEDLMIVPTQDGRLFRWSPSAPSDPADLVPNAPFANRGVFCTDERHVVLIGAGGDPRRIAWSDQEKPEVWAATNTNLAGGKQLETEGKSLRGLRAAGGNLIFTDNDVHKMTYVGPPAAYGIVRIGPNVGLLNPRAVGQLAGVTSWLSSNGMWKYDGAIQPQRCSVQDWLFSTLNRDYIGRIFAAPNPAFGELWWYFPDESATECNRYCGIGLNEEGQPWLIGQQARSAADWRAGMAKPIMGTTDGRLYLHEMGWTDNGYPRLAKCFAETGALRIGQEGQRYHLRQVEGDWDGPTTAAKIRTFARRISMGPETQGGPFVARPDGVFDIRGVSGISCRYRIESNLDGEWAVGQPRVLTAPGGFR